jgi:hypothetical protein
VREPLKPIIVKLAAVIHLDDQARELLARMRREGVRLIPTGSTMQAIVQQIESEIAEDMSGLSEPDEEEQDSVSVVAS